MFIAAFLRRPRIYHISVSALPLSGSLLHHVSALARSAKLQLQFAAGAFDELGQTGLYLAHEFDKSGSALDHVILNGLASGEWIPTSERFHQGEVLMLARIGRPGIGVEVLEKGSVAQPDTLENSDEIDHVRRSVDLEMEMEIGERGLFVVVARFGLDQLAMKLLQPRQFGGGDERRRLFCSEPFEQQANLTQFFVAS